MSPALKKLACKLLLEQKKTGLT